MYHSALSVNIFNTTLKNVLSSLYPFYPFRFYFYEYLPFMFVVFNNAVFVINITIIFDNKSYIAELINRDNRLLYCNYKVIEKRITLFIQGNKSNIRKVFITQENNSDLHIIPFTCF